MTLWVTITDENTSDLAPLYTTTLRISEEFYIAGCHPPMNENRGSAGSNSCLREAIFTAVGVEALEIAGGRGRKPTYGSEACTRILHKVQSTPNREQEDGTATRSLSTLQRSLRAEGRGLERVGAITIRAVLYEAGYSYQLTRTWCPNGIALRKRKEGVVTVIDPDTQGGKCIERAYTLAKHGGD